MIESRQLKKFLKDQWVIVCSGKHFVKTSELLKGESNAWIRVQEVKLIIIIKGENTISLLSFEPWERLCSSVSGGWC